MKKRAGQPHPSRRLPLLHATSLAMPVPQDTCKQLRLSQTCCEALLKIARSRWAHQPGRWLWLLNSSSLIAAPWAAQEQRVERNSRASGAGQAQTRTRCLSFSAYPPVCVLMLPVAAVDACISSSAFG